MVLSMRWRFSLAYQRKRIFDPWAIGHFLFGALTASGAIAFDLPILMSFWATLAIAICWEFFEMKIGLHENTWNVLLDIALPLAAYWITIWLTLQIPIGTDHHANIFIIILIVYLYANWIAWQARFEGDREFID